MVYLLYVNFSEHEPWGRSLQEECRSRRDLEDSIMAYRFLCDIKFKIEVYESDKLVKTGEWKKAKEVSYETIIRKVG